VIIKQIASDLKTLVAGATGYVEYSPPNQGSPTAAKNVPNTGVFRVVMVGVGRIRKDGGMNRYAEFVVVVLDPLSGGDPNASNLEASIQAESLIGVIGDYSGADAQTQEEIDSTISRESGRTVTALTFRVHYKLTEE
jgi:hypothetical protein